MGDHPTLRAIAAQPHRDARIDDFVDLGVGERETAEEGADERLHDQEVEELMSGERGVGDVESGAADLSLVGARQRKLDLGSLASPFVTQLGVARDVRVQEPTLETVFIGLTGKELRD